MTDFTQTTHFSLKKPAIGGSTDKWGEYLNLNLDEIDTQLHTLASQTTERSLESLSNVVIELAPVTGQVLQFGTSNWTAAALDIPSDLGDLSSVEIASPADGQVLAYSSANQRWENQNAGTATLADGDVTEPKLSVTVQAKLNSILPVEAGTPADGQILRYNSESTLWEMQNFTGGSITTLEDTDVSNVTTGSVLVYSAGAQWTARALSTSDVDGLQTALDGKFNASQVTNYAQNLLSASSAAEARQALIVDPQGTDNSTPVSLDRTAHDYLSLSDQQITLGAIDFSADVTGSVPASRITSESAPDGYVLRSDGAGNAAWEELSTEEGGEIIGAIVAMEINTNGELLLLHTGSFDEDNVYINGNSQLILEV